MRYSRGRKSLREILIQHNAEDAFLAGMAGLQPRAQSVIPEPRAKRKRRTLASGPSEHQYQVVVIQWWRSACNQYKLPEFALFAIPNGGSRSQVQNAKGQWYSAEGQRLRAEGLRRGVYDLMLAHSVGGAHGLFVEMKVKPNKPSDEQNAFRDYLTYAGYENAVCYDSEQAIRAITDYIKCGPKRYHGYISVA